VGKPRLRRLVVSSFVLLVVPGLTGCGSPKPHTPEMIFVSTRDGDYAIYAVAGGGHEWRLTKAKGDPSTPAGLFFQVQPAWSPDARSIAFASRRNGRSHIYVMRADGRGVRRITGGPADDESPAWSPNGRWIVFARGGELWLVPAAGGQVRQLGRGIGGDAADPAWSPNGKLVAYDYRLPGYSIREIWIVGADGRNAYALTRLRQVSALPSWSPGGRRLAFQSNARGGHFEIYSVGLDGRGLRRETRSSIDTIDPAWSPTGKDIAFSRGGTIWTVDRSGRLQKVTSGKNDVSPAWRPAARSRS
jgi:Tol biopolymer transport system component